MSRERRPTGSEIWGSLVGGGTGAVALFALTVAVGRFSSGEALRLIESITPAVRFLGVGVVTASITVLGLLLTLLGLSLNSEYQFKPRFYRRVGHITTLSVIGLVTAVAMLLAATVPVGEVDEARFYDAYYYVLASGISVLGGVTISMGLMIGATLRGLVRIGRPESTSDLLDLPEGTDSEG